MIRNYTVSKVDLKKKKKKKERKKASSTQNK